MTTKPPFKGHRSYASGVEDSPIDTGRPPRVGQSKPYTSGANARGQYQRRTSGPEPGERSGFARSDGPRKGFTGR